MIEFDELIDIVPDFFVRRVENVGAIGMDIDAILVFAVNVSANMRTAFEDKAGFSFFMLL